MFVTIIGQGTMGLEVLDQVPDLDAIVVPVGGGGLIAGMENPQRWKFGRSPDSLMSSYLGPFHPSPATPFPLSDSSLSSAFVIANNIMLVKTC
jgi:hypothetical protein